MMDYSGRLVADLKLLGDARDRQVLDPGDHEGVRGQQLRGKEIRFGLSHVLAIRPTCSRMVKPYVSNFVH